MTTLSFRRQVLVLSILIAVLAGAYILGLVFSPARVSKREAETPLLPALKKELVAKIALASAEGSLELTRSGESWSIPVGDQTFPASESRIDTFFDFLEELKRSRIVTDNPDSWTDFEVGTDAASRIQLLDASGQALVDLIVGKSSAGGNDNYVRLEGSNEVVLTNSAFHYYLNVQTRFWAHLLILPEELEGRDIMRISVRSDLVFPDGGPGDLDYTLLLSDERPGLWQVAGEPDTRLDSDAVDRLASDLADLEGTDFAVAVSAKEAGLDEPSAQILISTLDDRDFRLLVGSLIGENQAYVAREEREYIYKVSEWRLKGILKPITELVEQKQEQEQQ
jgi:hypothetical protein